MNDKLRFHLIFYIIGIFFAETCSRSDPKGVYNPIDFFFLRLVYGSYYLVAGSYLIKKGRRNDRRKVYSFGVLFGLYEFFITKVYYTSEPDNIFYIGHVNIILVTRIGFVRHALMSFTFPFYLTIFLVGRVNPEIARKYAKKIVLIAAFFYSLLAPVQGVSLIRALLNDIPPFIYVYLLYRGPKIEIERVVINPRKAIWIALLPYVLFGPLWRADRLPHDYRAYIITLLFYLLAFAMIFYSKYRGVDISGEGMTVTPRDFLKAFMAFELMTVFFYAIFFVAPALLWAVFIGFIIASLPFSVYAVYKVFRRFFIIVNGYGRSTGKAHSLWRACSSLW